MTIKELLSAYEYYGRTKNVKELIGLLNKIHKQYKEMQSSNILYSLEGIATVRKLNYLIVQINKKIKEINNKK